MGRARACKEPLLLGEQLFWAEQRPDQGGRTTLMRQVAPGRRCKISPWQLEFAQPGP